MTTKPSYLDRVDRYFVCVRERDLERLLALFAADATMILPDGRELSGSAAIRQLFASVFASAAPVPTPIATIAGDDGVASEIETRLPDGKVRRTANFYTFDREGLIQRLSHYARNA